MKTGETDLKKILESLKPEQQPGDFVFCVVHDLSKINMDDIVMIFQEKEGKTIILRKELADILRLPYTFVASWITLTVHSSLAAVGLTAAFSKALAERGIGCNSVAAYYHDHIFVDKHHAEEAMDTLIKLSAL